jgi:predicted nucleotidyltransferase
MKKIPEGLLEEIVERLKEGLHPDKIILFGSHAYGKPNDDSDIDLLIVLSESDEPRYRREQKAYRYLRGLTAPTELVIATQQEVERASRVPVSLINQAVQRGKILYG